MVAKPKQPADEVLARALAVGETVAAAARTAGVSESTVFGRLRDPAFTARVDEIRDTMLLSVRGLFICRMRVACEALYQLLGHPAPAAQARAAKILVELALKLNGRDGRARSAGRDAAPGEPSAIPAPTAESSDMGSEAPAAASSGDGVGPETIEPCPDLTDEGHTTGGPVLATSTDVHEPVTRDGGRVDEVPAVLAAGTGVERASTEKLSKPVTGGQEGAGVEGASDGELSKPVTGGQEEVGRPPVRAGEKSAWELSKPVTAGPGSEGEHARSTKRGGPHLRSGVGTGPESATGAFLSGADELSAGLRVALERLGTA